MKRILLVTSVLPWPLRRNGGGQRTGLLQKALSKWGDVDVVLFGSADAREWSDPAKQSMLDGAGVKGVFVSDIPTPKRRPWLGPIGSLIYCVQWHTWRYRPYQPGVAHLAELNRARQYDLVVGRYLKPSMQADLAALGRPMILDFDDIDLQTLQSHLAAKPWPGINGKLGAKLSINRVAAIQSRSLVPFKTVFVTSEEDRALVDHSHTVVLPNIPFADNAEMRLEPLLPNDSQELLFVGDLQFPPNVHGLDRFLSQIWPLVRQRVPQASVTIIGRGLTEERKSAWSKIAGTNVVGFVDDLVACYQRCAFTISPMYSGGGTKIKVLESLAYGRTLVATDHSLRGYDRLVQDPPSLAVAKSDAEFADACVTLLTNPTLRNQMSQRGQKLVEEHFSFGMFQRVVDEAISTL